MRQLEGNRSGDRGTVATTASSEYLSCTIGGVACAASFESIQEVFLGIPPAVTLPGCPPWFVGVFTRRLHMFGLVDPLPLLMGRPEAPARAIPRRRRPLHRSTNDGYTPHTSNDGDHAGGVVIIGEGDRRLGLAIDAIGPSIMLDTAAILPPTHVSTLPDLPFQPRYAAGITARSQEHVGMIILDIAALLDDLHAALAAEQQATVQDTATERSARP